MRPGPTRVTELTVEHPGFRVGPVSIDLAEGEVVAVLGPSGCGKTTLLRSLAGLMPLRGGGVAWEGQDLTSVPPEHRGVGYVPQGLSLFPHLTVRRNVGFALEMDGADGAGGATDRREKVGGLLDRFGLDELAMRHPSDLSFGQKQRVAMARALAADPRLLLWDEPLSALDVVARDDLVELILDVTSRDRIPLMLVTHDPSLAYSVADRFLVLARGRVVFLGSPERFLEAPPDPFGARFAGFENILTPEDLRAASGEPWGAWWRERAGRNGLAFAAGELRSSDPGAPGSLPGRVRRVHREPEGWRVGLSCGPWRLQQRLPLDASIPELGARMQVHVPERMLHPIGGR